MYFTTDNFQIASLEPVLGKKKTVCEVECYFFLYPKMYGYSFKMTYKNKIIIIHYPVVLPTASQLQKSS